MANPQLELLSDTHTEGGRHEWVLLSDWEVEGFVVPKGFKTDLGSIPHIFWSIVGPSEIAHGAILHDYLYDQAVIPRKDADKLLRSVIIEEIGRFRANLVFYAVRLFGSNVYGLDRRTK